MAYKLIWSPVSRDDLRDIVRFISRDSSERAQSFALRLMAQADILQEHPEIGRVGRCPDLKLGGVHGSDETAVYAELCEAVDEWIRLHETEGRPLPEPTAFVAPEAVA